MKTEAELQMEAVKERAIEIARLFAHEADYVENAERPTDAPEVLSEALAATIAFCALTRIPMLTHAKAQYIVTLVGADCEAEVAAVRERLGMPEPERIFDGSPFEAELLPFGGELLQ